MHSPAKKTVATRELLRQIASRSTGRIRVDTVDGALEVYLMHGEVVGAVAPDDDQALLRRVRLADAVSPSRLASLARTAADGQDLFGGLIDQVPTEVLEPVLAERFRENLVRWVSQTEEPVFTALPGVFVDNMQLGHDTVQLVQACCRTADRAASYPVDTEVVPGQGRSSGELESALRSRVSSAGITIDALLADFPAEFLTARAVVAGMLDTGLLLEGGVELRELHTDEVELLKPLSASRFEGDEEDADDAPTVRAVNELLDLEEEDTPAPATPVEPDAGTVSPVGDLSKWLHTGDLDEEDMAFFADHEDDRGGGSGGFTTESHNLDKVDVTDHADELIEVDEAPAARFSAPVLSEDTAVEKISVCNDVFRAAAVAFDRVEGAGRGQAVIQLLVDGSPSKFSAIFHGLSITSDGELLVDQVLDNLAGRPASEHRQLLNSALKDVMDRALNVAADELPDEEFDQLYESVAGYNQRLGL